MQDLDNVLTVLKKSGVTFSLSKYYFTYLFIKILKYYVSRLGFTTLEKKSAAVKRLAYFRSLAELESDLGFFNYYHKFVDYYIYITKPLKELKTRLLYKILIKGRKRKTYIENISANNDIFPLSETYKNI